MGNPKRMESPRRMQTPGWTRRFGVAGALLAFVAMVSAQRPEPDLTRIYRSVAPEAWYVGGFGGYSLLILGSEERRRGGGISVAYSREEPRLRFGNQPGEVVLEAYGYETSSKGFGKNDPDSTATLGALAMVRYRYPWVPSVSSYVDLGVGLQYASRRTHDLPSRLSSTPVIDFGLIFEGRRETLVGLRLLHVSNAGTIQPNRGQNMFFLTVSVRL
jgi:hypothetical protein